VAHVKTSVAAEAAQCKRANSARIDASNVHGDSTISVSIQIYSNFNYNFVFRPVIPVS